MYKQMATPAQLAKCNPKQEPQSKSIGGNTDTTRLGSAGLKNGTDMDQDDNSEDVPEKKPTVKRKSAKSSHQNRGSGGGGAGVTMESFQDGGENQTTASNMESNNSQRSQYHPHQPSPGNMQDNNSGGDVSRLGSVGMNNYSQQAARGDEYGAKMNDVSTIYGNRLPPPHSPSSYSMGDHQHGGPHSTHSSSNMDLGPNLGVLYDQYGAPNMRASYSPNAKQPVPSMGNLNRSGVGGGPMMMPGISYNSPQRYLSGGPPSMSQHIGPTPTLNQLLQSPNPVQRYQGNSYGDYHMGGNSGVLSGGGGAAAGVSSGGAPHPKELSPSSAGSNGGSVVGSTGSGVVPAPVSGDGQQVPYPGMPNWPGGRGHMYQPPMTSSGYRNQSGGGPLMEMGGQSSGKRPVQPQPTYMGPGGSSPYPTTGSGGGSGGSNNSGLPSSPQQQSSSQQAPPALQPPPSPHSQYNAQYPPPHRYSSPSPQGRNNLPISMANQPYSSQMTHQYPPQQGPPPSSMPVYDQRYMPISPQQQQQQQHCPQQNYMMIRGAGQQQHGGPLPPAAQPPPSSSSSSTSSTSSTSSNRNQPSPHTQMPPMGGGGGNMSGVSSSTPQPPFSTSTITSTSSLLSSSHQSISTQNKDGCEQLSTNSSNNVETTGSVDDALSDSSNQSLSSNQGSQGLQGGGGSGSGGGLPPAGVSPLRPTPSPSGSSGSRSMSPAVGPQQQQPTPLPSQQQQNIPMPPRPSSGQSENSQQQRMSQSPMAATQGYNQPIPPSHMGPPMYGGKMHANMMAPYSPQSQPYPSGGANSRNSNSGGGAGAGGGLGMQGYNNYHGGHPNSMGHAYPNRMPSQGYPNQYHNNQYGGQNYQPAPQQPPPPPPHSMTPGVGGGKGSGGIPTGAQVAAQAAVMAAAAVNSVPGSAQRHPAPYMKQHLQQRGYGQGAVGPMSTMNYNSNVPGGVPPQSMLGMLGPGGGSGNRDSPVMQMPPPAPPTSSTTPTPSSSSLMMGGPSGHPPGVSAANSTPPHLASTLVGNLSENSCDNSNESNTPSMGSGPGGELRGMPLALGMPSNDSGGPMHDEASQHSTASNNSTADERAETPRPKKDIQMSHPPTPASALPSPGAASMSSYHDDFESVSSPSWPRTPASPVINSQHHEYHSKRPDGLHKLYDISDDPERKHFLDRLIQFNEERGSTITQCPTISKQPLDLFRLYLGVKERGGFLEVTKGKLWKEVAGIVGVGASSSGAYTLRKQYIKHLLPFECKFDQGGIDPRPIISQLENTTRKKNSKQVAAPSPGSSNSQDSFQQNNNQSLDSFPTASASYSGNQYPSGGQPSDYGHGVSMDHPSSMMPNHNTHPPVSGPGTGSAPMIVGTSNAPDSINVQNPFADDIPQCYPRNGMGANSSGALQSGVVGSQAGYSYGHHRPQTMTSSYPTSNQSGTGSQYPSYPDSMTRGSVPPQRPPMPPPHEQYAGDAYRRPPMTNHEGYQNRPILEQYGSGAGTNSTVYPPPPPQGRPAMQANASGHYGYGPQYDRERYEQTQNIAIGSNQPNVIPPHGQSSDPIMYPPAQHRYPNQQMLQRPYGGAAPISGPGASTTGANASNQTQGPPSQSNPPSSVPYQASSSPQDSNYQNYSGNQGNLYPSQSKMISTYGHQGPKRHPDFLKLPDNQYPPFSGPPSTGPPTQQSQANTTATTSVPNSGQTQTPPTQQSPPQQPPPPVTMYPAWRHDNQFPQYSNQGPTAPQPPQIPCPPTASPREEWDSRRPPSDPNVINSQWSGIHPRYPPPPQTTGPPSNSQPTAPQQPPPHSSGGYYYQQNNGVVPPQQNHLMVPPVPSPPSTNARMRLPMTRDKQQPPLQTPFPPISQAKIAPPPMMTSAQYTPKKEIVFPENSVEAVSPLLIKRRRLGARDIIPVEAWRLMMALKSGLLCESTWALDVLSVLLYDEVAILYFNLQNLPGLLDVLLEHYRKCLVQMFDFNDETATQQKVVDNSTKWYKLNKEPEDIDEQKCYRHLHDLGVVDHVDCNDKIILLDCENYTYHTSRGKTVKVVSCADLFVSDEKRSWDEFNNSENQQSKSSSTDLIEDLTSHIQTHFEMTRRAVPFVRVLEDFRLPADEIKTEGEVNGACAGNCWKDSASTNCVGEAACSSAILIKQESAEEGEEDDDKCDKSFSALDGDVLKDQNIQQGEKRKRIDDYEDEAYNRDEASLYLVDDAQDSLARRAICLSNILRSLSFVPGNDTELSKSQSFLSVLGKLLLLNHEHAFRKVSPRNYDKDDEPDILGSCSSLYGEKEWWWDALHVLRENTLVTLANISGRLDLSIFPEEVGLPILDGLLHWAVCPSAYAMDPLPSLPPQSILSPQRLSLEALCKLSVQECNVDLVMATPPFSRIERLFAFLSRSLGRYEDQVVREFAVVLLHYFAQADTGIARDIALQNQSISLLIAFVEQAEQNAVQVANTQGINMLRENPEMMGTSLDMLRRAAHTLFCLAQVPDNKPLFVQHQHRLLQLVTSQILDQHVASIVADVLFECSTDDLEPS